MVRADGESIAHLIRPARVCAEQARRALQVTIHDVWTAVAEAKEAG